MAEKNQLHLPDLTIQGFRGIDSLTIPRLGRATLITGRNGIGKTSILDAVRVYAAHGHYSIFFALLETREEVRFYSRTDDDSTPIVDWRPLFYGFDTRDNARITIGPRDPAEQLVIEAKATDKHYKGYSDAFAKHYRDIPFQELQSHFRGNTDVAPWVIMSGEPNSGSYAFVGIPVQSNAITDSITCVSLGPHVLPNDQLTALSRDEQAENELAKEILQLVSIHDVDFVTMRKERTLATGGQRAMYKVATYADYLPVKSLGDGAIRLYGLALSLANSSGGLLLIDEAENGLHYSAQVDLWRVILRVAEEKGIQVLATTHSWDCIRGFAQAAHECEDAEGILVRLEKDADGLRAVTYSERNLIIAAQQDIEVR